MILDIERIREVITSITRNKSRSILTGFGIFWGLLMLLVLHGGGQGVRHLVAFNFDGFASNTGFIMCDRTSIGYKGLKEGRSWSMSLSDIDLLTDRLQGAECVTYSDSKGATFTRDGRSFGGIITGIPVEWTAIETPDLRYGRYINAVDMESSRKVCIIGRQVYEQLFPDGGDPCGEYIECGGLNYQVIGVDFSERNISVNGQTSSSITIPASVYRSVYNLGDDIWMIGLLGREGWRMKDIMEDAREILYRKYTIHPEDESALQAFDTESILGLINNIFKGIDLLLILIGLGTLLAAAISVSNIMMVTVKERTVEIGIRRAIGATPGMILGQIMSESIALTTVFGAVGIMVSVMILSLLELATGKNIFQISFTTAVIALLIIMILGILAGAMPSLRAMKIRPVDAMRDE